MNRPHARSRGQVRRDNIRFWAGMILAAVVVTVVAWFLLSAFIILGS